MMAENVEQHFDPKTFKLETAPFDARFPYTNQTKNCWQNYVDFHRCIKKFGEEESRCQYFFRTYKSLCPGPWVESWDDQMESGTFPGRI
ncbi:cytochrome c oxidase subunit 6B1 [Pocillopora verrucosa]|uniref:Cytochrome c oxidase subunit n=1 Tax=Pocillopora damicornis TaxID=46731 RepID=A0A3M6TF57_POCDA|nr:cytochrome c oxidase subunit 6B1-like [Pocillopora damicornis]XP_058956223.1 cytochrome c oxidase subunit 6B1-like [Pocillopora verrucosa]RMX39968.1 hypothetical protein pdam_00024168 [Pocillopora damicornis]